MKKLQLLFILFLLFTGSGSMSAAWKHVGMEGEIIRSMTAMDSVVLVSAESGSMFRSTDKGETWDKIISASQPDKFVNFFLPKDSLIYAGTWGSGVAVTTDKGISWKQINSGLFDPYISALGLVNNTLWAATKDRGMFWFDNSSSAWVQSNNGLADSSISLFAIIQGYMMVYTFNKSFYASSDGGQSWLYANLTISGRDISTVTINGLDAFIGIFDEGIYYSNDYVTWNQRNQGLEEKTINAIAVKGDSVIAATDAGVFGSQDYALTWGRRNEGLDVVYVHSLLIAGDDLFAGTDEGVYKTKLSDVATSVDEQAQPSANSFLLAPNPADNYINVMPATPHENGSVSISDIKGTRLLSGQFQAGLSSESIDVSSLPAGLYFVSIESGSKKAVRMFVKK